MHDMTNATQGVDYPRALRMGRARRGLTKQEWAGEVDIHPSLVGRYESGERSPKSDLLERWASAAGVPLSVMLGWGEGP
jgi:transcriptional regulator with XRE-family HTH domain